MTLNRLPANYFSETEQSAFAPENMVPGIEPSPDRMLQGRLFSYLDTQRYRIGPNFQQLPINCPISQVNSYNQNGPMDLRDSGSAVNYEPNNAPVTYKDDAKWNQAPIKIDAFTQQKKAFRRDGAENQGGFARARHPCKYGDPALGISSETFLRLFSRAPRMVIEP